MKISKIFFFLGIILIYETAFAKYIKYTPPKIFKVYDKNLEKVSKKSTVKRNNDYKLSEESKQNNEKYTQIAINHLIKETGITKNELLVNDILTDKKSVTVHLRQIFNGMKVSGVTANVNIDKNNGNVLLFFSNLIPMKTKKSVSSKETNSTTQEINFEKRKNIEFVYTTDSNDGIDITKAIKIFCKKYEIDFNKKDIIIEPINDEKKLNCNNVNGVKNISNLQICKNLLPVEENTFDFIYKISANLGNNWVLIDISTTTGKIYNESDLIRMATFNAVPWYETSILTAESRIIKNPEDINASPYGWNKIGNDTFYSTEGNNVIAFLNRKNPDENTINGLVKTSKENELIFDYKINKTALEAKENYKAAVSNAFYVTNTLHDFFYEYGFDEQNGNFQNDNFGKGGVENDRLFVFIQDSEPSCMMTWEDGVPPIMKLGVEKCEGNGDKEFDDAFNNDVIIHEYTHGVSDRLIGGPSDPMCQIEMESMSINEGFSDFFALLLSVREGDTHDKSVMFNEYGLCQSRIYPYTTDMNKNRLNYHNLSHAGDVTKESHFGGMIWASMLTEVMWNILDIYGITNNLILNSNYNENSESEIEDSETEIEENEIEIEENKTENENGEIGIEDNETAIEDIETVIEDNETLINDSETKIKRSLDTPGNAIMATLIIDAMKKMPCNPTFIEARDSIITSQKTLWNGNKEMNCALWKGFAKRGLGFNATIEITTKNEITNYDYVNNYDIPDYCKE